MFVNINHCLCIALIKIPVEQKRKKRKKIETNGVQWLIIFYAFFFLFRFESWLAVRRECERKRDECDDNHRPWKHSHRIKGNNNVSFDGCVYILPRLHTYTSNSFHVVQQLDEKKGNSKKKKGENGSFHACFIMSPLDTCDCLCAYEMDTKFKCMAMHVLVIITL